MARFEVTEYTVRSDRVRAPLDLAVVTDLHDGPFEELLPFLRRCDAALLVGDLVDRHASIGYLNAAEFLKEAPKCAPTFYAIGNHEWKLEHRADYWPLVEQSDVRVLDDCWVRFGGIVLGGMSSHPEGEICEDLPARMGKEDGFKLLMCHHPEYYEPYVQGHGIDLTLSGHAHGGQVRVFGRGLYAPGQGILPKYTSGSYDGGKLIVSRGVTNGSWAPRLWNPLELILLHLRPEDKR